MLIYTDFEYEKYLQDTNWTRQDTDYLLQLCNQYDLRFFKIYDTWLLEKEYNKVLLILHHIL